MGTTLASPHEVDAVDVDVVDAFGGGAGHDVQYHVDDETGVEGELVAEVPKSIWHRQSTSACASWAALQPDHRHG